MAKHVHRGRSAALLTLGTLLLAPAVAAAQQADEQASLKVLELTLPDAIELALRHNLQVRIASLTPDFSEEQIRFSRSQFDPVFTFNIPQQFNRSTQPQSSVLGGADVLTQESVVAGFNVGAATTWGLGWSLGATASRFVTNNQFTTFNPQYSTSLNLNVRQPLLRNRGDVNKQGWLVAQNNFSVSREQFRQQLQLQMFQVIQGYWGLVQAYRAVDIATVSLRLAREQLQRNNTMVRIGVLAAADVIQTEQLVADAELTLIQSQIALDNQQDVMRSLLNLDAVVDEGWDVEVVPLDEPATEAADIDMADAVAEALQKSPLIRQDRFNLESRKIDLGAAGNQLLPQVDFIGSITVSGLGGDQIFRGGDIFGSTGILEIQEGGLGDSITQLFSGDFRNWSLGVQVTFPIRNDAARAQYAQASIRERQAATQVQDRELQIRLAVQQAARNIAGGTQAVGAAENALSIAERQYDAELRRFQNGVTSTFQLLNFQRLLTGARQRELGALIGLNLAIANFEFNKGTLLESVGIRIEDAGVGGPRLRAREADRVQLPTSIDAEESGAGGGESEDPPAVSGQAR